VCVCVGGGGVLYLLDLDDKNVCSEVYVESLMKVMTGAFRFCHDIY
jgi:hypothetical protein